MKKLTAILSVCLILLLSLTIAVSAADEYIPVHTEQELSDLLGRVKEYLDASENEVVTKLGETENVVVTQALVRSWGILESDDAAPEQIDDAYEALFNAFLFTGLITNTHDTVLSDPEAAENLYLAAVQLLDQEYFDLLEAAGEDAEAIEYAAYLRDISEALVEDPEAFSEEETGDWLVDLYGELYMAAGLKAIAHTENLPTPEELFAGDEDSASLIPNPVVEYETPDEVNAFLGFEMPDLMDLCECTTEYYSIIADILAEGCFSLKDGTVLFRLSPEKDADISGIYDATYYTDWNIYSTDVEVDTYGSMYVAKGTVTLHTGEQFSFAIDTDGVDFDTFENIVFFFIESCRNQSLAK